MKITILCVGKIKEKFYRDAVAEYEKRLSRYCRFEVTEVADEKTPDHASENMELLIKEKEAERMEKYLKEGAYVIALAIEGKQLDSVELSHSGNIRHKPYYFCDRWFAGTRGTHFKTGRL